MTPTAGTDAATIPPARSTRPLTGVIGTPHLDPVPRLRVDSPEQPAPLQLPLSLDDELPLFAKDR